MNFRGLPGFSLTEAGAITPFPRAGRWNTPLRDVAEFDICNETIRGVIHPNKLFRRREIGYIFRVPDSELDDIETFHETVGGILRPFYFVPVITVPGTRLYVRKEPDFKPVPVDPGKAEDTLQQWWDYTLMMKAEIPAAEILA